MAELNGLDLLDAYVRRLIHIKARQLLRHPGFSRSDFDDLVQELTLRLWRKVPQFDPIRASFHTYAAHVLESCVATIVRERRRLKRAAGLRAQSLENTFVQRGSASTPLADLVSDSDLERRTGVDARRKQITAEVNRAVETLSPDLRDLCRRLMTGTTASVARDLGVSRYEVRKTVARIRREFAKTNLADF